MNDVKKIRPCESCPFLTGSPMTLTYDRRAEIADALLGGGRFPCHKTVDYSKDDEGAANSGTFCMGAAAVMENGNADEGGACMNQMFRIEGRLGLIPYRPDDLDTHCVPGSLEEWVEYGNEE